MKIGIDIRMLGRKRTGDETVFFNLVKNLALIDDENEYSLFVDRRSPEEMIAITNSLGIEGKTNFRFVMLRAKNKFSWNFLILPLYLHKHPVDIYHTQYIVPFFISRTVKIVTHIHDVSFCAYPEYINWKDRLFLNLLIPISLRRADIVIAVSEFTKKEILKYYDIEEKKVVVVHNAVSDTFTSNTNTDSEHIEKIRLHYDLPKKFILYVGTLQPRKNIPSLLQAFSVMRSKIPDMKLVVIGNRQGYHYDTRIDAVIREYALQEVVVFPGFVNQEDLSIIMRMAEVFVFPSLYEGFGLPVLEAMSQSVPVLASDIESLREVCGDAALFIDTTNLAKFSEILYTISTMMQTREALKIAGIKQMQKFSWRSSVSRLQDIYKTLF
jgi:glycosyltransferase involved in cell wall biosynthesis